MTDSVPARQPEAVTPLPDQAPAPGPRRLALPLGQPARGLVCVVAYVAVVALAGALLSLIAAGPMAAFVSVMWALLMLVPLAVVAPSPAARPAPVENTLPVLQRGQTPAGPPEALQP